MINSILERHRRRVTIDRVLITNTADNLQTLVTDQDEIKVHVNAHFNKLLVVRNQDKLYLQDGLRNTLPSLGLMNNGMIELWTLLL